MDWSQLSVLVTGGTGSFGQQFVKSLMARRPKRVIIFSRDELKQHEMQQAIPDPETKLRFFLGDVRDRVRLRRALEGVDVVVHAAALKQVPACEYNPLEAVKTNIDGASNLVDAAIDAKVQKVLALSTDKAVNPVNLYGATKLVAEKIFVQGNAYAGERGTRFSCVRYGNVIASRGSVIPLFASQRGGGKITLTDERMTRFWITLQQGVDFVIRCVEKMHGGEIFVPKIPSMRLQDLARVVAPDCQIEFIGIRPGEKLHEMLVSRDESRHALETSDSYLIQPTHPWWGGLPVSPDQQPMQPEFEYSSETNSEWLSEPQLRAMIPEHFL